MNRQLPSSQRQEGIVLIVVLVMLVVIGLSTAALTRNVLSTDQIGQNVRSEALASEAAQLALTYCEQQATRLPGTPGITIYDGSVTPVWSTFSNWQLTSGANSPTKLTEDQVKSSNAAISFGSYRPQCMAETTTVGTGNAVTIVTARGFSPDYAADTNGYTTRGSVVWVQSILRIQ